MPDLLLGLHSSPYMRHSVIKLLAESESSLFNVSGFFHDDSKCVIHRNHYDRRCVIYDSNKRRKTFVKIDYMTL